MKQVQRIAALFLVVGAALAGGFFGGKATDAGAAGTTVNCNIPNNVVCKVSNPAGIKTVKVSVNFGGNIGNVDVVNEAYLGCPKSVDVHWDPIVPNFHFTVGACTELKVTNGNPPVGGSTTSGLVVVVPAGRHGSAYNPTPRVFFLKNSNGGGDPKPLGLTAKPTYMHGYVGHCGGPYSFILCDQQFFLLCKVLGGTWIPGEEPGEGDCDGAHDNWPSDPPSGD